jgi:hypothetical protein
VQAGGAILHRPPARVRWPLAIALAAVMTSSAAKLDPVDTLASERIRTLVDACSRQMTDSVCRVASDPSAIAPGAAVFVAGVGQVDSEAYRSLRAAGDAMCAEVRRSCASDWTGPACSTARRLWGGR